MNKHEIIKRLKNIAGHVVYTVGEEPFVMSLDDGIAVYKAIELLEKTETVEAIPVDWIEAEIKKLRAMDFELATMTAGMIEAMLKRWKEEQEGE